MRQIFAACAAVLLAGCGLPIGVQVASYALDGVSYLASGKSLTDHALSVATDQNCAAFRVIEGAEICTDYTDGEETSADMFVAALEDLAGDGEGARLAALSPSDNPDADYFIELPPRQDVASAPGPDPVVVPDELAALLPETDGLVATGGAGAPMVSAFASLPRPIDQPAIDQPAVRASHRVSLPVAPAVTVEPASKGWADVPSSSAAPSQPRPAVAKTGAAIAPTAPRFVLVLGSFSRASNAAALVHRHRAFGVSVTRAELARGVFYRVVTGPLDSDGLGAMRRKVVQGGVTTAWAAPVCGTAMAAPRCVQIN